MKQMLWLAISVLVIWLFPSLVQAQPNRQLPGTRPHLPGSPPANFPEANSRTRAAESGVGLESTDFYGKKGYPRVLGDSVVTSASGANGASSAGVSGGNTGVQSSGSGGFQGNSGNQIGQQGGGTVLGGVFGGLWGRLHGEPNEVREWGPGGFPLGELQTTKR